MTGLTTIFGTAGDDIIFDIGLTGGPYFYDMGDGNDHFIGGVADSTVSGGNGNDFINGSRGHNTLSGDAGNDEIWSGRHTSILDGGADDDLLVLELQKGADHTATGGTGADVFNLINASNTKQSIVTITDYNFFEDSLMIDGVSLGSLIAGVDYTLTTLNSDIYIQFNDDDIVILENSAFTPNPITTNSIVDGTDLNDVMNLGYTDAAGESSSNGDDVIYGYGGDDVIYGGRGDDFISGGEGDDVIYGSRGQNTLNGDAGNDTLHSGNNSSTLDGGTGDDQLVASMNKNGTHTLTGGAGADTFIFNAGTTAKGNAIVTDFDIFEDSVLFGESFLPFLADFEDTEAGLEIEFANGGTVIFEGLNTEDALFLGFGGPFIEG